MDTPHMARKKPALSPLKPRKIPLPHPASDIEQLKKVIRRLLERMEKALAEDSDVFGKTSLAATLVMIAELMLKLEAVGVSDEKEGPRGPQLASADIALVEAFIHKMRSGGDAPSAQ